MGDPASLLVACTAFDALIKYYAISMLNERDEAKM